MKIRMIITALTLFASVLSGCGKYSDSLNNGELESSLAFSAESRTEKDIERQIQVIADSMDLWVGLTDYGGIYQYTVTDLDQNGRLELITSINQGTGRFTYSSYYEINEVMDGLTAYELARQEGDSEADIMVDSVPVYYDSEHDIYHYIFDDYIRYSYTLSHENKRAISLKNGELSETILAYKTTQYMDSSTTCTFRDGNGNEISNDQYCNAADMIYPSFSKKEADFSWYLPKTDSPLVTMDRQELIDVLMESYQGFLIH